MPYIGAAPEANEGLARRNRPAAARRSTVVPSTPRYAGLHRRDGAGRCPGEPHDYLLNCC